MSSRRMQAMVNAAAFIGVVAIVLCLLVPTAAALDSCREHQPRVNVDVPGVGADVARGDSIFDDNRRLRHTCAWCQRNHLSFDFLGCEVGPWMALHFTTPFAVYVLFNSVPWTIIAVFANEFYEVSSVLFRIGDSVMFADDGDMETLAGAIVGDVGLQGGAALLAGYAFRVIFVVPTLVSSKMRARSLDGGKKFSGASAYSVPGHRRRAAYFWAAVLLGVAGYIAGFETSGGLRYGFWIYSALYLFFVLFVYGYAFDRDAVDDALLWRQQLDGSRYAYKWPALVAWAAIALAVHWSFYVSTSSQPWLARNEWYQSWLFAVPITVLLVVVGIVVSAVRGDGYSAWTLAGGQLAAGWYWLLVAAALEESAGVRATFTGLAWGSGIASLLCFAVTLLVVEWPNVRVPGTLAGQTLDAAQATRLGSRFGPVPGGAVSKALLMEDFGADEEDETVGYERRLLPPGGGGGGDGNPQYQALPADAASRGGLRYR